MCVISIFMALKFNYQYSLGAWTDRTMTMQLGYFEQMVRGLDPSHSKVANEFYFGFTYIMQQI